MIFFALIQLLSLGFCAPVFNIAPTESLLKDAMAPQTSLGDSIRTFNPGFYDTIHPENFAVQNKLSSTFQNPKVFKELMVAQEEAVAKSQKQLVALHSLKSSKLHPISDDLITSAENSLQDQKNALVSLESIYEASLNDRKAASLLKLTNAKQLAQDRQTSLFGKVKAWKDHAAAARSIASNDAQLKFIQGARTARTQPTIIQSAAGEDILGTPMNAGTSQVEGARPEQMLEQFDNTDKAGFMTPPRSGSPHTNADELFTPASTPDRAQSSPLSS